MEDEDGPREPVFTRSRANKEQLGFSLRTGTALKIIFSSYFNATTSGINYVQLAGQASNWNNTAVRWSSVSQTTFQVTFYQVDRPHPQACRLGWGCGFCISKKFPPKDQSLNRKCLKG